MPSAYDLFETTRDAVNAFMAEDRAKRVAEAIILIGQRPPVLAPIERLTEHQAEQRSCMVQAQKLKR